MKNKSDLSKKIPIQKKKQRLYAHQQYNSPQSIQSRNKEILDEIRNQRDKELEEKNKFKRFRPTTANENNNQQINSSRRGSTRVQPIDHHHMENHMEINEYYEIPSKEQENSEKLKFIPHSVPLKENLPKPIGRKHTQGAKITPVTQKGFNLINILKLNFFMTKLEFGPKYLRRILSFAKETKPISLKIITLFNIMASK